MRIKTINEKSLQILWAVVRQNNKVIRIAQRGAGFEQCVAVKETIKPVAVHLAHMRVPQFLNGFELGQLVQVFGRGHDPLLRAQC